MLLDLKKTPLVFPGQLLSTRMQFNNDQEPDDHGRLAVTGTLELIKWQRILLYTTSVVNMYIAIMPKQKRGTAPVLVIPDKGLMQVQH